MGHGHGHGGGDFPVEIAKAKTRYPSVWALIEIPGLLVHCELLVGDYSAG